MHWPRTSIRFAPKRARSVPARRAPRCAPRWALWLTLSALALHAGSCSRPRDDAAPRDPAVAAIAEERAGLGEPGYRGKILYEDYCAVCHGLTGEGDGFNADNLAPRPPVLRGAVTTWGEASVARVIREGSAAIGKSPLCPPFGRSLDDADRTLIVDFLREAWKDGDDAESR